MNEVVQFQAAYITLLPFAYGLVLEVNLDNVRLRAARWAKEAPFALEDIVMPHHGWD